MACSGEPGNTLVNLHTATDLFSPRPKNRSSTVEVEAKVIFAAWLCIFYSRHKTSSLNSRSKGADHSTHALEVDLIEVLNDEGGPCHKLIPFVVVSIHSRERPGCRYRLVGNRLSGGGETEIKLKSSAATFASRFAVERNRCDSMTFSCYRTRLR